MKEEIANSLKVNTEYGAGIYKSPDGILEVRWLPDENTGFIDIKNPDNLNYNKLKSKSLEYINNLPEGRWELNPDTPQKGKIYKRLFGDITESNPDMPNNALIMDTSKIDHPPAALRLQWIEDYKSRKQEAGNKKISATYNYKGVDFTLYTNKDAKGGMSTKPSVFAAKNALLRLHRKRKKEITENERTKILQEEFPDSPLNEVKALAKQVHELNERDILEKTELAHKTGQIVEDRTAISNEKFGWRSRHNLEVDDPTFNLQKSDKFPGKEYTNWKGIGETKKDQVLLDLSSPLHQTEDGPVRITPEMDKNAIRAALEHTDAVNVDHNQAWNLGQARRLAKQAAITGSLIAYGGLGTAASAFETDQRRKIAQHTGNILDYIQYGLSGFSLGADVISYAPHPITVAGGSVASGVADVINRGIDTTREIVSDVKRGYKPPEKPPEEKKE